MAQKKISDEVIALLKEIKKMRRDRPCEEIDRLTGIVHQWLATGADANHRLRPLDNLKRLIRINEDLASLKELLDEIESEGGGKK